MLKSPFLRRLLLFVLAPTLLAMVTVIYISSLNISELKVFSGKMYSSFALSNWEQLSETYFAKAETGTQAITRDGETLKALGSADIQKLAESLNPTFNRLKASNIVDGLYVYDLSSKVLFEAGVKLDYDFAKIATEVIDQTKPASQTMLNIGEKSLQYIYAFPIYERGKIKGVAMYIKNVAPLLQHLTEISHLSYGIYFNDGFLFNNFEFDATKINKNDESADFNNSKYSLVHFNMPVKNAEQVHLYIAKENTASLQQLDFYEILSYIATAIAILLISWAIFIVIRSVATVLIKSSDCMIKLSHHDFAISLPEYKHNDEVAKIISTVSILRDRLRESLEREEQEAEKTEHEKENRLKEIILGFEKRINDIVGLVEVASKDLSHDSEMLDSSISSTDSAVGSVNMISNGAISDIKTVAAATQDVTSAIENILSLTNRALAAISESVSMADNAVVETNHLEKAAHDIGEIVGLIQDVAEQTNLLALNATIEAARAGEQGKGFAVVASEVKQLATQTADATGKIKQRISEVQRISKSVVISISGIRGSVDSINKFSSDIATSVHEQSQATGEIDQNMQNVSDSIGKINQNMQNVVGEIKNIKDVAKNVLGSSSKLNEQVDNIHSCINHLREDLESL